LVFGGLSRRIRTRLDGKMERVAGTAKLPKKHANLPFFRAPFRKIPPIIPPNALAGGSWRRLDRSRASESHGNGAHASSRFRGPRPASEKEKRPHTLRDLSQAESDWDAWEKWRFALFVASPSKWLTCRFPSHIVPGGSKNRSGSIV